MLNKINIENLLFLDIETVPEHGSYELLDEYKRELWAQKTKHQRKEETGPGEFYENAGRWAEVGKIICISVGFFKWKALTVLAQPLLAAPALPQGQAVPMPSPEQNGVELDAEPLTWSSAFAIIFPPSVV
jgi:hypothetical protein